MINIIFFYLNKFKTFPSAEEQLNKKKNIKHLQKHTIAASVLIST